MTTTQMGGRGEVAGLLAKAGDLQSRILFVLGAFIVFRLGTHIPVPGVDAWALAKVQAANSGGLLDMLNLFTGGSISRMALFSLGVMPYISASIIMQLLSYAYPALAELKKEGEMGQRKITQYTRYLTVLIAFGQGLGLATAWEGSTAQIGSEVLNLVVDPGMMFRLQTAFTLMTATVFLMWLGEQINSRGIGNGMSLLIFAGIVAELPSAIYQTMEQVRVGSLTDILGFAVIAVAVITMFAVVFMETAQRRVLVQYPRRNAQVGGNVAESNHIPLKLNVGGVMPAIFASSLLMLPMYVISNFPNAEWAQVVGSHFAAGKPLNMVFYVSMIIFFCFFWASLQFNSENVADNLKKQNAFIPGVRPGASTAKYFDYVLSRITTVGALYMAAICILPQIIINQFNIPQSAAYLMGGTSVLIIVSVAIDLMTKIQSHIMAQKYSSMLKKSQFRKKVRK